MQTHDPKSQSPSVLNHPSATEWMEFLYGELAPERKRELKSHLNQCAACAEQVTNWRASMSALDEWTLPARHRVRRERQPVLILKWAIAAVVVVGVGFALGRQASPAAGELAALKASVAQLTATMEHERGINASNAVVAATAVANAEALRLLSDYAKLNEARRAEDQQAAAVALRAFEARLARLRAELETVAVNTEDGFQQTQAGLSRLAFLAASDATKPNQLP
jgi:anti-sigma factor RsiW